MTSPTQAPTPADDEPPLLSFTDGVNASEIGRVYIENGKAYFTGNLDKSAQKLFKVLVKHLNKKLAADRAQAVRKALEQARYDLANTLPDIPMPAWRIIEKYLKDTAEKAKVQND